MKPALSTAQNAVAEMIAEGYCDKAISNRLGLALDTVRKHGMAIRAHYGASNRTQVALILKTGKTPASMTEAA